MDTKDTYPLGPSWNRLESYHKIPINMRKLELSSMDGLESKIEQCDRPHILTLVEIIWIPFSKKIGGAYLVIEGLSLALVKCDITKYVAVWNIKVNRLMQRWEGYQNQ